MLAYMHIPQCLIKTFQKAKNLSFLSLSTILGLTLSLPLAMISLVQASSAPSITREIVIHPRVPSDQAFISNLAAISDLIVRGRVEKVESYWAPDGLIKSRNRVKIHYAIHGQSQTEIVVSTMGGWIESEQIGMAVSHYPTLFVDEEVILFLQKINQGYRISEGLLGKLTVANKVVTRADLARQSSLKEFMLALEQTVNQQLKSTYFPNNWQEQETKVLSAHPRSLQQFKFNGKKWPTNQVKYKINVNTPQAGGVNGSNLAFLSAIQQAATRWSEVATADFSLVYDGTHTSTKLEKNNVNEVFWLNPTLFAEDPINYNPNFLAYTKHTFVAGGAVIEADLWINELFTWNATGNIQTGQYDLESVMLHEFGHVVGLGHDSDPSKPTLAEQEAGGDPNSVMFWLVPSATLKHSLHLNDSAGISTIYPCAAAPCNPSLAYAAMLPLTVAISGQLAYTDANGVEVALAIPTGAVTEPITLGVRSLVPSGLPLDQISSNHAIQLDAINQAGVVNDYTFALSSMLTISYTNASVAVLDEATLHILTFSKSNNTWQEAGCGDYTRHPASNSIQVPLCQTGPLALVGKFNTTTTVFLPVILR